MAVGVRSSAKALILSNYFLSFFWTTASRPKNGNALFNVFCEIYSSLKSFSRASFIIFYSAIANAASITSCLLSPLAELSIASQNFCAAFRSESNNCATLSFWTGVSPHPLHEI